MQLVGEMEVQEHDVVTKDGSILNQRSTVYIKKCRYLEQSGCVGMCVNMCKVWRGLRLFTKLPCNCKSYLREHVSVCGWSTGCINLS
jgi:hypothetical protein